jgi:hypothetical protein
MLFPEYRRHPGFNVIFWISMLHQRFVYTRLSNPYMT